jgi:hypothetical protein
MLVKQSEMLGIFGQGWQEQLVKAVHTVSPQIVLTTTAVDNLGTIYASMMASGFKKPTFTGEALDAEGTKTFRELIKRSQQPGPTVRAFLKSLQELAIAGKIDRYHYDPVAAGKDAALKAKLGPLSPLDKIGAAAAATGKTVTVAVVGLAVVALVVGAIIYLPKPARKAG